MDTLETLPYSGCLTQPAWLPQSHWLEHIPFAFHIVELTRPQVFVELGVFAGASYCAFCQALDALAIPCQAYGVDNWTGDPHNGDTAPEVLGQLRAHHDPRYAPFSRLVPSSFDSAVTHFADGSIDLLHIDGYHTYQAVRHDFETWKPKLSERAVVLFHDTNVREYDFGVWQFWEELSQIYPSFNFLHEHGLGVLAVGTAIPDAMREFLATANDHPERVRALFSRLGQRIRLVHTRDSLIETAAANQHTHESTIAELQRSHAAELTKTLREHVAEVSSLRFAIAEAEQTTLQVRLQSEETGKLTAMLTAELDVKRQYALQLEEAARVSYARETARANEWAREWERLETNARAWYDRMTQLDALIAKYHEGNHQLYTAKQELEAALLTTNAAMIEQVRENQRLRAELEAVYQSLAFRVAHKGSQASRKIAPPGTRRRRFVGTIRRALASVKRTSLQACRRMTGGFTRQG